MNPNAYVLATLYQKFLQDPQSIDKGWQNVFGQMDSKARTLLQSLYDQKGQKQPSSTGKMPSFSQDKKEKLSMRALMMVRAFRVRGHLHANLDPLGLANRPQHPELDPSQYGFSESHQDVQIDLDGVLGLESTTFGDLLHRLQTIYCGTIGVEYMHIQDPEQKAWIGENIENYEQRYTDANQDDIFQNLLKASAFEHFLRVKYPGAKRFGLEGAESLIPALDIILKKAAEKKVKDVVFGMAHRGRLNVLANVIGKPVRAILSEFQGQTPEEIQGSGDVKYHLGCTTEKEIGGEKLRLSLVPNPSHLEAVNPVVVGRVRALQGKNYDQALGVLIHGDAAIAGQGLVAETLTLSELEGYHIGGTLHVIINNQIGFTTNPQHSRSSPYCSDVAKQIHAPIFHVNGDDPEAVTYVARLAYEFREKFNKDVVIDLCCYRRYGHNEMDEPAFTQPAMYKIIRQKKDPYSLYKHWLKDAKKITEDKVKQQEDNYQKTLQKEFQESESYQPKTSDWVDEDWLAFSQDISRTAPTGIDEKTFDRVSQALTAVPKRFSLHPRLKRLLKEKTLDQRIDWAKGEALAFGSLLGEGIPVRLSGQDSQRGTFSQRHAVYVDQETEENFVPLNHISSGQASFEVVNSPLSEASVLGFEYGFSGTLPQQLVLWEAQFGDFSNGAQVIIDQFLASGEAKWLRKTGLVMLLPHGYEGQGPEHSSARLERFLQLCAENNMIVANCTTPANYFHILRRQLYGDFRKPLILMTPKSLLRHTSAISKKEDFLQGTTFQPMLTDPLADKMLKEDVSRVIFCSGKVYYDLLEAREKVPHHRVALVRIEQLYPFPQDQVRTIVKSYSHGKIIWCQEEPENMGAWLCLRSYFETILKELGRDPIEFCGRDAAASPASGYLNVYRERQTQLVQKALGM